MILEIAGSIGGGVTLFVVFEVAKKIFIDRTAELAEKHIVKPALEFVKTKIFWDELDPLVDRLGLEAATKTTLFNFGDNDGAHEALQFVLGAYSETIHEEKMNA